MDSMLQDLLAWITQHPHLSGLLIFVIALLESLVVIGLLIPGAILLFGIGALVATGALQLLPTLLWTTAGAVAGDTMSFLLGRHYHQHLRVMWPLRRYPELVNRGADFFYRHGGKSVFMARFVGPVRPILPAIAGMMDMGRARFLAVDIIASLLWAPAYILPGMVFGASLGLAAEVAGRLVVLLVLVTGITWFSVLLIRGIVRLLQPHAAAAVDATLDWSRNHPLIKPLAGSLLDPDHPEARGLTILSGVLFFTLWLLLLISSRVLHGHFLGDIDNYLFHFFQDLRTPWVYRMMVFISLLGNQVLLAIVLTAGCLWLVWKGCSKAAFHWLGAYASTGILTYVLKYTAQIARPVDFHGGFSFPSAHTSMSLAVYGFMALLIARELQFRRRWLPYTLAGLLVTAIAFSRLYLGVHWFSDILGGACLGLFWLTLLGIAYDRHPAPRLPVKRLVSVVSIVLALAVSWQMQTRFTSDLVHYARRIETLTITLNSWKDSLWQNLPAFRVDLEGLNEQPLNIQWAGSLARLQEILMEQDWQAAPALGPSSILNWLAPQPDIDRLPILPQVHDGQHHELLLVRNAEAADHLTALRLWPANVELADADKPVWIGTVSYLALDQSLYLITSLRTARDFDAPLTAIQEAVADKVNTKRVQREFAGTGDLEWEGLVLLLWESNH